MASRVVGRLLVYPLVLFCGMALGSDFRLTSSTYPTGRFPRVDDGSSPSLAGRLGGESAELRALRAAERQMFPELGADPDASLAERWDRETSGDVEQESRSRLVRLGSWDSALDRLAQPDFPVRRHPRVERYVKYFSSNAKGRKLFTTWLRRSGFYRHVIEDELRVNELPLDLRSIVFIESGFWPTARSKAGAVGLWQFMPRTARVYGLLVDGNYDERRSIWRSTEAAARHLADLHEHLRNWDLALAAYNYGHDNLTRRMQELGASDFWELASIEGALPKETVLYVPKVHAIALILKNLEHFGFADVEQAEPAEAVAIKVPPGTRLSMIARAAGTSTRVVKEYNPEFREDVIPDRGGPMVVHIPQRGLARARAMLPKLIQEDGASALDLSASLDFDWGSDDFGTDGRSPLERLARPASRSTTKLMADFDEPIRDAPAEVAANLLPKSPPTQTDLVHAVRHGVVQTSGEKDGLVWRSLRSLPRERIVHQIAPGDTVWDLAQMYGVSPAHIVRTNKLSNPDVLVIGRKLVMNVPTVPAKPAASESVADSGGEEATPKTIELETERVEESARPKEPAASSESATESRSATRQSTSKVQRKKRRGRHRSR